MLAGHVQTFFPWRLRAACATAAFAVASIAIAGPLEDLAATAGKKGPVIWYESSPADMADKVIASFNKRFPDVKVKQVRLVGGNELAVRTVQEMQARGYSADALTGGADHIWQLHERDYVEPVDWEALGVAKGLAPTPFMIATTASVFVVLWNDKKVKEAETPKNWNEVVDPKWASRMGSWVRAAAFAQLAAKLGAVEAQDLLTRYIKLKPMLFKSTFTLAQAVAAGEVDIGIGFYHTTLPPIVAGAPVKYKALDIVPMYTIMSAVTKNAKNPEGAKLLLAWLATEEGALAYEAATSRGNPLVPSTKTAQLLMGRQIAEFPPAQSGTLAKITEEFNKMLEAVGSAR